MKKIILIAVCFAFFNITFSGAQVIGKIFPNLTGETLKDIQLTIPSDTKGKYTLIAMAYSLDAEKDLKTWLGPVYNKFVAKTGMFDFDYDVNIYFIPMFTGARQASASMAKKQMKEDTDKEYYSYVLVYRGELQAYKKELQFEEKDIPYLFLIDKEGKIIFATSGNYSDKKMEEIEEKME